MRQQYKIYAFAFIIILIMTMLINKQNILAKDSNSTNLIDLSKIPNEEEFYIDLNGNWNFFEEELLTPKEVQEQLDKQAGKIVSVPGSLQQQTGKVNTFGTYSTMINIPDKYVDETLAIQVPFQYSAYTLYVDAVKVAENGMVGEDSSSHTSEMTPRTAYFKANANKILVTMQISSFDHIRGGFENTITIGEATVMTQKLSRNMASTLFVNGCIFIIGLFMVLFSWYRKEEALFFLFGIFAMFIAVRALFAVPFYYTFMLPNISWLWGTRLEYILTEITALFFVLLLWKSHEKEFSKKIMYVITTAIALLIVMTLFTQPVFFQNLFFKVFYLSVPFFFYVIYVIMKGLKKRNTYSKVNLIGIGLIFIAFFNDFASGNGWYESPSLMQQAVAIYVIIHVVLMSKNFAKTTRKREKLNEELVVLNNTLDKRVQEQTAQLREANKHLQRLATVDGLTGIYNRRSFNEFMEKTFKNLSEEDLPLSLLMIDFDEFKKYNDYYGHISGDRLLHKVVMIISDQLPENSFFSRYGGEEFVVVLLATWEEEAYKIANQVRIAVERALLDHPLSKFGIVTLSIGVSTMVNKDDFRSEVELIAVADERLYQGKELGRNRVI